MGNGTSKGVKAEKRVFVLHENFHRDIKMFRFKKWCDMLKSGFLRQKYEEPSVYCKKVNFYMISLAQWELIIICLQNASLKVDDLEAVKHQSWGEGFSTTFKRFRIVILPDPFPSKMQTLGITPVILEH